MNLQGTYEDIQEIGSGGGGTVFRAFHVRMQKYVVLKKIHDSIQDSVDIRGELNVLKNLRHSYLPTVLDFIEDDGSIYTVMDYIPGESFDSLLKKGVRFSQAQVIRFASQLGEVLTYLHGQNPPIVHGDIKPANIMLTPEGNICLIDFNISQIKNGTVSQNMGYTPGFAPPEQVAMVQEMQQFLASCNTNGSQTFAVNQMNNQLTAQNGTVLLNNQPMAQNGTVLLNNQPTAQNSTVLLNNQPMAQNGTVLLNNQPTANDGTVLLNNSQMQNNGAPMMNPSEQQGSGTMLLDYQKSNNLIPQGSNRPNVPQNMKYRMDERSDIYSVGATLYAILCGVTPNADFTNIVPIENIIGNCSEGLLNLIQKCMVYRPDKRWQSAVEFARATANITKADKRYKRLLRRQEFTIIFCILGMAGCILLAIFGKERIGIEHRNVYDNLVEQMEDLVEEGDYSELDDLEELYLEAIGEFPELAGAYYEKAVFLYQGRYYDDLISFLEEKVLTPGKSFTNEETGTFYFLLANCYLELEDIDEALLYYKTAVSYDVMDGTFYSDYAIALARDGQLDKAEEILEQAISLGLADDRMLLAEGEILGKQGEIEKASESFAECIEETRDDYIMARAYIMWAKLYATDSGSVEMLTQRTVVLEEANGAVASEYRAMILEQLAQAYIDLAGLTGERDTYLRAIECLNEIASLGWDTYITHTNIGILYESIGELVLAQEEYLNMLDDYGEDYRTYKRLAFLEISIQATRENQDRDYGTFLEYYQMAKDLYETSGARGDSDMEMQLLEQAYGQLQEGNWF